MTARIDDPIAYFAGSWAYTRQLEDRFAGTQGKATGAADFTLAGDGLNWREKGRLNLNGTKTLVTRRYRIVPGEDIDSDWMVLFEDGRPFHPLRPDHEVEHLCRSDLYEGLIRAVGQDRFETSWRVKGPKKDQLIRTAYRRRQSRSTTSAT